MSSILQEYEKYWQNLRSTSSSLVNKASTTTSTTNLARSDGHPLRVYTDIPSVEEFLTHPGFIISMCLYCYLVVIPF